MALAFFSHVCEFIQNPLKTQCIGAESQDTGAKLCIEKWAEADNDESFFAGYVTIYYKNDSSLPVEASEQVIVENVSFKAILISTESSTAFGFTHIFSSSTDALRPHFERLLDALLLCSFPNDAATRSFLPWYKSSKKKLWQGNLHFTVPCKRVVLWS